MGILDIENRTENWKTARYFSPFFKDEAARLRLVRKLGEPNETQASEVHIELFWKGMRDYFWGKAAKKKGYKKDAATEHTDDLAAIYKDLFSCLRTEICDFGSFSNLKGKNYDTSKENWKDTLFSNLFETEIDIVLETPGHLYIGEAKYKSRLGGDGDLFLVHQLIRQYVTIKVLLNLLGTEKKVVQFVVANNRDHTMNFGQVKFLLDQGWMRKENVLTWEDIKKLWPPLTAYGAQPIV